jgi:hypothetical protein
MIDAYNASAIAYRHNDGDLIHRDCLDPAIREEVRDKAEWSDERFYAEILEVDYGYHEVSRYTIREGESEAQHVLGQNDSGRWRVNALVRAQELLAETDDPEEYGDILNELENEVAAELEEKLDRLAATICDKCGERIE